MPKIPTISKLFAWNLEGKGLEIRNSSFTHPLNSSTQWIEISVEQLRWCWFLGSVDYLDMLIYTCFIFSLKLKTEIMIEILGWHLKIPRIHMRCYSSKGPAIKLLEGHYLPKHWMMKFGITVNWILCHCLWHKLLTI